MNASEECADLRYRRVRLVRSPTASTAEGRPACPTPRRRRRGSAGPVDRSGVVNPVRTATNAALETGAALTGSVTSGATSTMSRAGRRSGTRAVTTSARATGGDRAAERRPMDLSQGRYRWICPSRRARASAAARGSMEEGRGADEQSVLHTPIDLRLRSRTPGERRRTRRGCTDLRRPARRRCSHALDRHRAVGVDQGVGGQ